MSHADDPDFLNAVPDALRDAGHDVASFADPMLALDALEAAETVEVLVTRIGFQEGKPNGITFAHVTAAWRFAFFRRQAQERLASIRRWSAAGSALVALEKTAK